MNKKEILSVYERLAGLTEKMAEAAHAENWSDFDRLGSQCTREVNGIKNKIIPPLEGKPRVRKIDLLKQILANDRAIRAATEHSEESMELSHH